MLHYSMHKKWKRSCGYSTRGTDWFSICWSGKHLFLFQILMGHDIFSGGSSNRISQGDLWRKNTHS
jgi:hypothetical protein